MVYRHNDDTYNTIVFMVEVFSCYTFISIKKYSALNVRVLVFNYDYILGRHVSIKLRHIMSKFTVGMWCVSFICTGYIESGAQCAYRVVVTIRTGC